MNKLLIICIILYTLLLTLHICNAQWQWQNPLPQGNTVVSVCFVDTLNGWALGGGILHTDDGGSTWEMQDIGGEYSLLDIFFTDAMHGWAVGDQFVNLRTTDGGTTWVSNYNSMSRLPGQLTGVCFVDSLTGWAVGWAAAASNGPVIKHTTDGGLTWDNQPYPSTFITGKHCVFFINSQEGWITRGNNIIHTYDGGDTWEDQESNTPNDLENIYFFNSDYGWAVGQNGTVLFTTNGGALWENSTDPVLAGTCLFDISFIDSTNGWIAGYHDDETKNGIIFKTTDGGVNWTEEITDPEIKAIYCLAKESGSACFAAGANGEMLVTRNDGNEWDEIFYSFTDTRFQDVCFVDQETGWAVGGLFTDNDTIPMIFNSINGGVTWEDQEVPFVENQSFHKVFFSDDQHGWVLGGGLFNTTDGGENWELQSIGLTGNDLFFVDPETGWCIGENGRIQKTTDGGWNWTDQISGTDNSLTSVFFIDSQKGWIAGDTIILHTSDGGELWEKQSVGIYFWKDIYFIDESVGWVTGPGWGYGCGLTLKTNNGGQQWDIIYDCGFHELVFFDAENGRGRSKTEPIGGASSPPYSNIMRTNDGGVTWESETMPTLIDGGICFVDSIHGWAVGSNGIILHTENGGTTNLPELRTQNSELSIRIYPNPTSGPVIGHWALVTGQWVRISIYDVYGREVATILNQKMPAGEHTIQYDLSGLPDGIYLVRLQAGDEMVIAKILKN